MVDVVRMFQDAELLLEKNKPTEALEIYSSCTHFTNDCDTKVQRLVGMAKCYYYMNRLEDVERITSLVLENVSLSDLTKGEVFSIRANAYYKAARYKQAEKICFKMLEIGERKFSSRAHSLLGVIYGDRYLYTQGENKKEWLTKAIKEHEKAYELAVTKLEKIRRIHNISWVHYLMKDYNVAEEYIIEVLGLVEEPLDKAIALNLLAVIQIGQEKYEKADVTLGDALQILRVEGSVGSEWVAQNHQYRGLLLFKKKNYVEAESHFEYALELSKEKDLIRDAAQLYHELFRMYSDVDKQKSLRYYSEYKKLEEKFVIKEEEEDETEDLYSVSGT